MKQEQLRQQIIEVAIEVTIVNGFIKSWNEKMIIAITNESKGWEISKYTDDPPFEFMRSLFSHCVLYEGRQFAIVKTMQPGQMTTQLFPSKKHWIIQLFNYRWLRSRFWYHKTKNQVLNGLSTFRAVIKIIYFNKK